MANTSPIREMSWPESNPSNTRTSSLSSSFSADSSSAAEPDFTIPRQGPRIVIPQEIIVEQRQFWQNCLVGVLYDDAHVKEEHMAASISKHWRLEDQVSVVGRKRNIYVGGFPLEYYSDYVAAQVGEMVEEVVQVDFSVQGFRNLRYLRVRVNIDPSKPFLMGFYVLLDNGRVIWIQCQYERVFRICKQCGCIGHIVRDCKRSRRIVQQVVNEQKQRIRGAFGFSCFIDYESALFVNEAVAFRMSNSRRTTMARIKKEDSSSNTPQSQSLSSQNKPNGQSQEGDENFIDVMEIDPVAVTIQEQLITQAMGPPSFNLSYFGVYVPSTSIVSVTHHSFPYSGGNPLWSPQAIQFSELAQIFTSSFTAVNEVANMQLQEHMEEPQSLDLQHELEQQVHVASEDEEYNPLILTHFFKSFTTVSGLGFIWHDIIDQLLQLRPNIQAQFANSFASWDSTSANSTNIDPLLVWVTKFLKPDVGVGLIVDSNGPEQRWDIFQTAFDVVPTIINFHKTLIFIPTSSGPFLACPLNWFYAYHMYVCLSEKWSLFATFPLTSFYDCFDPFTPMKKLVKRKAIVDIASSSKKHKTYGTVLGKFQLLQARPLQKFPIKKRACLWWSWILLLRVRRRLSHISLLRIYDIHFMELSRDKLPFDN
ncbi:Zinc knuckle CX2CX4HX4C [Senna tora]|uniref:Zinc knuckle CX2CX4HX4C n=1 Tax=Senna tora TaxID=362788 RepID=A0A834X188_9FABA|nr:Zinc knuckle CX2CX4HX4C [Senna tora]